MNVSLAGWFTGLSDALQVAFVSFVFTIVSSLTTIWLTNRHTWKMERERWENDRQRDEELYERSQRDRELTDQRRLVETLAGDCSSMSMQVAWLSALSSTLYVFSKEQKALPREDLKLFMIPMERIETHKDLCRDVQIRTLVGGFTEKCLAMLTEINGDDRAEVKEKLMKETWSANEQVQMRAREILNHGTSNQ